MTEQDRPSPRRRLPKASDFLASELRAQILGDGLTPGAPLSSESELIEQYGLSRGSVREALRLLEAEGLIAIRRGPKGGIHVVHPDAGPLARSLALLFTTQETTLGDFFQFRLALEPHVAAEAARSASDEEKRSMLRTAREAEADPERAADFHAELGRCASNSIFGFLLTALHHVLEWHLRLETIGPGDVEATIQAHRRIAKAIHSGDANRAEVAMRRHLQAFADLLDQHGRLGEPIVPKSTWQRSPHDILGR
ncbi:MAG: FCD domain-containing protein [Actinomycetota bacterium]